MAQLDILQRFLDAGSELTQSTQRNAEKLAKSLVDAGEVQANQAQQVARDLLEQGRRNRERLVDLVDREVRAQIGRMGLATRADLRRLEKKVDALQKRVPAKKAVKKKATKKKSAAKKSATKKSSAKKG